MALYKLTTFEVTNEEECAVIVVRADSETAARDFADTLTGGQYGYFAKGQDVHVTELAPDGPAALLAEGARVV